MRKSLNLLAGVFLFVLVFSFFSFKSDAASDSANISGNLLVGDQHRWGQLELSSPLSLGSYQSDSLYKVDYTLTSELTFATPLYLRSTYFQISNTRIYFNFNGFNDGSNKSYHYLSYSGSVYLTGSVLNNPSLYFSSVVFGPANDATVFPTNYVYNVVFNINSAVIVQDPDSADLYQNGYNDGYSAGLSEGQSQGYSNGYSDGYSDGETSGYNSGYQAGVESVDTQSYYDAGYSAGQAAGYAEGYDSGYDTGYADAMARVEQWGADTTEYPVEVDHYTNSDGEISLYAYIDNYAYYKDTDGNGFYRYSFTGDFLGTAYYIRTINFDLDPNHVYKILLTNYWSNFPGTGFFYIDMGSSSFSFSERDHEDYKDVYVFANGSDLGSMINFRIEGICPSDSTSERMDVYFDDLIIYDYGPIGNTQNQIANQTDDLTNGYDSSAGDSASNTFADNAASYEQAESSIFTSAKSSLDSFEFYDLSSDSSVLTGLSFVASMMTSIFGAMGGLSGGAGIVLSVLFSVMLVSIVIGTYRYFVSSGKTHSSGSKKGGKG